MHDSTKQPSCLIGPCYPVSVCIYHYEWVYSIRRYVEKCNVCKSKGLSSNWWYSKVMMTVYDSVTKETLDHQPSHLSSNFGVSLRRVFVTTNWGWQAMTSNDLIDSWVMYSAPSWEWRSSRTLGFCEIKRVVDMCSCHKCYILYKAYYKDSTLEYYIVVALCCCLSVPILLSKKYHSNVNTMELWGLQEPQTLLPRRDSASSLMA